MWSVGVRRIRFSVIHIITLLCSEWSFAPAIQTTSLFNCSCNFSHLRYLSPTGFAPLSYLGLICACDQKRSVLMWRVCVSRGKLLNVEDQHQLQLEHRCFRYNSDQRFFLYFSDQMNLLFSNEMTFAVSGDVCLLFSW